MKELENILKKTGMLCDPIENTIKIIGKRYALLILRNMSHLNQTGFNQLVESIDGINPRTLSTRLQEMEKDELIVRKVFEETPIRVEYRLTERGHALDALLDQLASFSLQYCPQQVFKDGKSRSFKQVYGKSARVLG